MENYRQGTKVKHRIISNLTLWPKELVTQFDNLLKNKNQTINSEIEFYEGKSIGGILTISEIAERLGISQALGNNKQGRLALFQIAGRIIAQESRNYLANEWSRNHAIEEVFGFDNITEDALYENLDWLCKNQERIEKSIFEYRSKDEPIKEIFLYDVTSSYFEGQMNELADYGYNRDKKQGKKQIVIGLLTDKYGYPVSVEVFKGNTNDTKTVSSQLNKLKKNFGVERVVFVGDKGMVKSAQIEAINSDMYQWNYLTSITKQQIATLINNDIIQLSMFDNEVFEVSQEDCTRYILRRNLSRAAEIRDSRLSKIKKIESLVMQQNKYLLEHKKANPEVALIKVNSKISSLKLKSVITSNLKDRIIGITINDSELEQIGILDGCYVIKTDTPKECMDAHTAHDRYTDLYNVEFAFRTMKTTLEQLRPIFVRKEDRTRGHVFVTMLAYMIVKYITDELSELPYTRKFIFESLDKIKYEIFPMGEKEIKLLPKKLLDENEEILQKLRIKLKLN
jgi:transposase